MSLAIASVFVEWDDALEQLRGGYSWMASFWCLRKSSVAEELSHFLFLLDENVFSKF